MFRDFQLFLDKYKDIVDNLLKLTDYIENQGLSVRIEEQAMKIKNVEFHVVIVGHFKRGKSTLINYFLGDDILPTGVIPITSIITRIKYSDKPKANVHFKSGKKIDVSVDAIEEFVSEQKNSRNEKEVHLIGLFYNSEILKNGLVLIDTPGIGSSYLHNNDVAYEYLPNADAAIFLVSSDPPIGEGELNYLEEVKKYINKIFFIQNKVDYLSQEDKRTTIEFAQNILDKKLNVKVKVKVYPISAKLALEGRKNSNKRVIDKSEILIFEKDLEEFLLKEKGSFLIKSYHDKMDHLLGDIEGYFNFRIELLINPIETLEDKLEDFKSKINETEYLKKEAMALVEVNLKEMIDELRGELNLFRKSIYEEIEGHIDSIYNENRTASSKELHEVLNSFIEEKIEKEYTKWANEASLRVKKDYESIINQFTKRLNNTIEVLNKISFEIFRFKIAEPLDNLQLVDRDTFYFKFGRYRTGSILLDSKALIFLLPKNIRDKKILIKAHERLKNELEKNANNLVWDYSLKIKDSKYDFERIFNESINLIVDNLENIITTTIERRNSELNKVMDEISLYDELQKKIRTYREVLSNSKI